MSECLEEWRKQAADTNKEESRLVCWGGGGGGEEDGRMTNQQGEAKAHQQRTRRQCRTRQVRSRGGGVPLSRVRGAPEMQQEGSQTAAAVAGIGCTCHMCPWPALEAATPP